MQDPTNMLWSCHHKKVKGKDTIVLDKPLKHGSLNDCIRSATRRSVETIITKFE